MEGCDAVVEFGTRHKFRKKVGGREIKAQGLRAGVLGSGWDPREVEKMPRQRSTAGDRSGKNRPHAPKDLFPCWQSQSLPQSCKGRSSEGHREPGVLPTVAGFQAAFTHVTGALSL